MLLFKTEKDERVVSASLIAEASEEEAYQKQPEKGHKLELVPEGCW